jgi:hypothetical protein
MSQIYFLFCSFFVVEKMMLYIFIAALFASFILLLTDSKVYFAAAFGIAAVILAVSSKYLFPSLSTAFPGDPAQGARIIGVSVMVLFIVYSCAVNFDVNRLISGALVFLIFAGVAFYAPKTIESSYDSVSNFALHINCPGFHYSAVYYSDHVVETTYFVKNDETFGSRVTTRPAKVTYYSYASSHIFYIDETTTLTFTQTSGESEIWYAWCYYSIEK